MSQPYWVNLWGSKPRQNDDCWIADDFGTLEEARACYNDPEAHFSFSSTCIAAWFELVGPGVCEQRPNPDYEEPDPRIVEEERQAARRSEIQEAAMQAGMMGGCDAYNEVMGYD